MTKLEELIKNLKKANERLKEALQANPTRMNKDATIQRFEFTFELAWKTIQAFASSQGNTCNSPKGCIREAGKLDLITEIEDIKEWFGFLNNRNLIAHSYNEEMSDKVYKKAFGFPEYVDALILNIEKSIN